MDARIRFASALALFASLAACGGNDDLNVQGTWKGTDNPSDSPKQHTDSIAAIRRDGSGIVMTGASDFYILPPIADGRQFFGAATLVRLGALPVFEQHLQNLYTAGKTQGGTMTIDYEAAAVSSGQLTPTECANALDCPLGSFTLQRDTDASSMKPLGNSNDWIQGVDMVNAVNLRFLIGQVRHDRSFEASYAGGCSFSGMLQTDDANPGFYEVSVTSHDTLCTPPASGLAFEAGSDMSHMFGDAPGTYLYVALMDVPVPRKILPNGFFVLEFRLP